jgi:propanol-preferring alcohol dehydrogenase
MKAQILRQPDDIDTSPLFYSDVPEPTPDDDEIRIRVSVCGVCHTDLHIAEGELAPQKANIIPGHQIVGEVDCVGKNVNRFAEGDAVGVTWLYSSCGKCEFCKSGNENLCDDARFTGYHHDGGYAEYVVVPADFAQPIPVGSTATQIAPLLCAGVIGYRSLRLCEIQPGQRLGLYGFGASAHVAIQIACHWGCETYAFTRSQHHRDHALELGAAWAGSATDDLPQKMNGSIIFAPAGEIVPQALRHLKKGGTLAINAVHMSPIPEIHYSLIYHERTVRSVANCTRRDAEELLKLASEIPIKTDIESYPLKQANEVLQRLKLSEIRGAAVLEIE